jgi:hypothetical protein
VAERGVFDEWLSDSPPMGVEKKVGEPAEVPKPGVMKAACAVHTQRKTNTQKVRKKFVQNKKQKLQDT